MTKKQAIDILRKQQEHLQGIDLSTYSVWQTNMRHYIKTFFGKDSPQYNFIDHFTFWYMERIAEAQIKDNIPVMDLFVSTAIESKAS